jgi:uncharacterized protein YgfB (UPF0149 family)
MLDHERIERQLASADLEQSGAAVHGMLCGLLCGGRPDALELWLADLLREADDSDLLVQECRGALCGLHQQTRQAMQEPGLGFSLLLPDDEKPLAVRGKAVCEWSEGFLYGLGLAGVSKQQTLSAETSEALKDCSEITRMEWTTLDGEDDEEALMEVSEFLWVAAMLVHEELAMNRK